MVSILLFTALQPLYTAQESSEKDDATWTLMYYISGDNKLSAIQQNHLEGMRQIGSTEEVNIAILIDFNEVDDSALYYLEGTTLNQQSWEAETSMDDPDTLSEYVQKVQSEMSSTYYALILSSNFGSGWQGIIKDEHGRDVQINMPELKSALAQITNDGEDKLDIFGIETCMTGNLAVAYQLKDYCDYFVAYPECALAGDWPFFQTNTQLNAEPTLSPEELCSYMVSFFEPKSVPQYHMVTTMSAIDLSVMPQIATQLDLLAEELISDIETYRPNILDAVDQTRVYAQYWNIDYYIDLVHFLTNLDIDNTEVVEAKNSIISLMSQAAIAIAALPSDNAGGLSIFLPRRAVDFDNSLRYDELPSPYEATDLSIDTAWDDFLISLLCLDENSPPEAPTITGESNGKKDVEYVYNISTSDPQGQQVYYFIEWGDDSDSGWIGPYDSGQGITASHTWSSTGDFTIRVKAKDTQDEESEWGILPVTMPYRASLPNFALLVGMISEREDDGIGGVRFLPNLLVDFMYHEELGPTFQLLTNKDGGFPCCGYLDTNQFRGIIKDNFICGIWMIP